jgi:hypothetical protein
MARKKGTVEARETDVIQVPDDLINETKEGENEMKTEEIMNALENEPKDDTKDVVSEDVLSEIGEIRDGGLEDKPVNEDVDHHEDDEVEETKEEDTGIKSQAQEMAEKIEGLLKEGKTMAEALSLVVTAVKPVRATVDRVALINSMNNISDLKAARKTAYAKKSKSKERPEALERYQNEIDTATARINEIIAEVNASECPWKKALEYGDTPDGALQYYIQDKEKEVEGEFADLLAGFEKQPTKAEIKAFTSVAKVATNWVPEVLRPSFERRLRNRDQRVYTLALRVQSLQDLRDGTRTFNTQAATPAGK